MDRWNAVQQFLYTGLRGERLQEPREWQHYTYSTAVFSAIPAAGQAPLGISIDSNADFLAFDLEVAASTNAAPQTVLEYPPLLIQIFDTGAGATFFNTDAHVFNVAGSGRRPGDLYPFRYVRAGGQLNVTLTNLDAVNTLDARVSLRGIQVFAPGDVRGFV